MSRSQKPALSEPRPPERFLDSSDSLGMTVRCGESNGLEIRMQNSEVPSRVGFRQSAIYNLQSEIARERMCL